MCDTPSFHIPCTVATCGDRVLVHIPGRHSPFAVATGGDPTDRTRFLPMLAYFLRIS